MKCTKYDICATPQFYGETTHKKFVEEVCLTEEHKICSHFLYGLHPEKDSPEWNRIKKWLIMRKHIEEKMPEKLRENLKNDKT